MSQKIKKRQFHEAAYHIAKKKHKRKRKNFISLPPKRVKTEGILALSTLLRV